MLNAVYKIRLAKRLFMIIREIKYQPEKAKSYLGSPCILRLPDGALIATHDYFGKGCPRNHENEESLTSVYRSEDNGDTWANVTHIMNCYWNHLFLHNGGLYIIGCSQQYGSIVIRRSDDGGFTWTHPTDSSTGLLFKASPYWDPPNYLSTAIPAFVHNGRIYRAFDDLDPLPFGPGFQSFVISAPVDADLLDARSWTMSNKLRFDQAWVPADWGEVRHAGWREANVMADPDGQLWSIIIVEAGGFAGEQAARIKILDDGKHIEFDPQTGFFGFPGAMAKFTIRRDPVTQKYLSFVTNLAHLDKLKAMLAIPAAGTRFHQKYDMRERDVLSLSVSDDLWNWRVVKPIMQDDSGLLPEDSIRLTGFQYADWHFDGDDIIFVVRTANRGANSFHDSNRILFSVLKNFRELI